jgi:predicted nicotinamide N-methyase
MKNPEKFIREVTRPGFATLRPDIALHIADELTPLWEKTESWLEENNVAPPYWAFSWPGSEAIAHHLAQHPELVRGKRVLDFAAGCGLAAIAAVIAGAERVEANEIDPLAIAAMTLNAAANNVKIDAIFGDIIGQPCRWDVIFCGDVCYEAPMTRHILPWLGEMAQEALVIIADPGRAYLPKNDFYEIARYDVPVTRELEDRTLRTTILYRIFIPHR